MVKENSTQEINEQFKKIDTSEKRKHFLIEGLI